MDFLTQRIEHDFTVKPVETLGNIALYKPGRPGPGYCHLTQGGMAAPAGAETVGAVGELGLVVRLQQQADHFADQLVRPRRQAERA